MQVEKLLNIIDNGQRFFTGVPDSYLKPLCDCLMATYGISDRHIIAANEGNCAALAAGYHLATGANPVVYMQNSGIGNIINPLASLLNNNVYGIPCIFIIGWRGEPGVDDEPQHIYQGEVTIELLRDMDIATFVIGERTTDVELDAKTKEFESLLDSGKSVAFVVCKGALSYDGDIAYKNGDGMPREEIIRHITTVSIKDIIVSTTGKASRELFEIRERNGQSHGSDFLTVGSMGHASSIALGIALNKTGTRVWCIDGDGALLMHMGAMAVIGSRKPKNMIHVVINNGAHESVGGMPTVGGNIDMVQIALGCGYPVAISVNNLDDLDKALVIANASHKLVFIEARAAIGSRADLGRPTITAKKNKEDFMSYLKELD